MAAPTREDAGLLIQFLQLGIASGIDEASDVVFSDDFDPETADAGDAAIRKLLSHWEILGTLVKHELISAELVGDTFWIAGAWERLGPAALRLREKHGEPHLMENFEALAKRSS